MWCSMFLGTLTNSGINLNQTFCYTLFILCLLFYQPVQQIFSFFGFKNTYILLSKL